MENLNNFFVQLDRKPGSWENRITLFAAYLIKENTKLTTVKSYISAIKAVLKDINIEVNEDKCLLNSLTRACHLTKDSFSIRLPIQRPMLNVILETTFKHHLDTGQCYIAHLYVALFSTAYYGLFKVGELMESDHVVKVRDVHIGENKNKILFILRSSKTHGEDSFPQSVKISKIQQLALCPFKLLRTYLSW